MCNHHPHCPPPEASDREAARVIAAYPEQGWSLLCNGVVLFDDTGELLPNGAIIEPHPSRGCTARSRASPAPHNPGRPR
jgi:hypothetical protein